MSLIKEIFDKGVPNRRTNCGKYNFVSVPVGYKMPDLSQIFTQPSVHTTQSNVNKEISFYVSEILPKPKRRESFKETIFVNTQKPIKFQATQQEECDEKSYDDFYDDFYDDNSWVDSFSTKNSSTFNDSSRDCSSDSDTKEYDKVDDILSWDGYMNDSNDNQIVCKSNSTKEDSRISDILNWSGSIEDYSVNQIVSNRNNSKESSCINDISNCSINMDIDKGSQTFSNDDSGKEDSRVSDILNWGDNMDNNDISQIISPNKKTIKNSCTDEAINWNRHVIDNNDNQTISTHNNIKKECCIKDLIDSNSSRDSSYVNEATNDNISNAIEENFESNINWMEKCYIKSDEEEFNNEYSFLPKETINEMYKVLKDDFGHDSFRHKQKQAIVAALFGHDVFVLMPTGAGKSLCYQLPAVVDSGITIVVSPLRALIEDQVSKLTQLCISAQSLTSELSSSKCIKFYNEILKKKKSIKLLYVTPEKVSGSEKFKQFLMELYKERMLSRFVIDEAHCITQWGHDFRPDYIQLNYFRKTFKNPIIPIMVLTATATPKVVTDIKLLLSIESSKTFISSFVRPNLKYDVIKSSSKTKDSLIKKIKRMYPKESGVFYCFSREDCKSLHETLKDYGISSVTYHAGLNDKTRAESQRKWMSNEVQVICATIAFGMGIDKHDVRFVVHFCMPKSIESYYQESGRAGRDGLPSYCVILYSYSDSIKQRNFIDGEKNSKGYKIKKTIGARTNQHEKVNEILEYCETVVECRRKVLVEHFGEKYDSKECKGNLETICDNCEINICSESLYNLYDFTKEAEIILKATMDISLTMRQMNDCYRGCINKRQKNSDMIQELEVYGHGSRFSESDINRFVIKLITKGYLKEELKTIEGNGYKNLVGYLSITKKGLEFLASPDKPKFCLYISVSKGRKKNLRNSELF